MALTIGRGIDSRLAINASSQSAFEILKFTWKVHFFIFSLELSNRNTPEEPSYVTSYDQKDACQLRCFFAFVPVHCR